MNLNSDEYISLVVKRYGYTNADDLYANLGYGGLRIVSLINKLKDEYKKKNVKDNPIESIKPETSHNAAKKTNSDGIVVDGIENCLVRYSKCCNPVPGDKIIGYITRGRGVSIHRQDCINIAAMYQDEAERSRLIDVSWANKNETSYSSTLTIVCNDRDGIVLEVANIVNDTKMSLKSINARSIKNSMAILEITVEVQNTDQLNTLIKNVKKLKDVIEVTRNS